MYRNQSNQTNLRISAALLALMLLLSACNTPTAPTAAPTFAQPEIVTEIPPTAIPTEAEEVNTLAVDVSGVAQNYTLETIPAVPASTDGPYWQAMPEFRQLTLTGYPVSGHLMKPQIFIYPVSDLAAANEVAGQIPGTLQALLQSQQPGETLPFLPLFNAAQVMHSQMKTLDFKNGSGVRYLTQFDQAPLPINNHELFYTFQGLTGDGKYYIAAVLPVNLPGLPADEMLTAQEAEEMVKDFTAYMDNTVGMLNQQAAGAFTPDLGKLDALIQSLEIH